MFKTLIHQSDTQREAPHTFLTKNIDATAGNRLAVKANLVLTDILLSMIQCLKHPS